jgi:adenylosuccinate lyase
MAEKLKIDFYSITNQVAPRKQEYWLLSGLASLAGSLYKAALDLRFLQTPSIGEISEPFETHQVGSSAMPFKRNPILAEKINSLGRYVAQLPRIAWDNAANSMLERTLDDSANRRLILAEAFLACDEMLACYSRIVKGWKINREIIQRNREVFMPFAATEKVLLAACKAGADRQLAHEKLRILSLQAWEAVQKGQKNPLMDLIRKDTYFSQYIKEEMIIKIFEETSVCWGCSKKGARICPNGTNCPSREPLQGKGACISYG